MHLIIPAIDIYATAACLVCVGLLYALDKARKKSKQPQRLFQSSSVRSAQRTAPKAPAINSFQQKGHDGVSAKADKTQASPNLQRVRPSSGMPSKMVDSDLLVPKSAVPEKTRQSAAPLLSYEAVVPLAATENKPRDTVEQPVRPFPEVLNVEQYSPLTDEIFDEATPVKMGDLTSEAVMAPFSRTLPERSRGGKAALSYARGALSGDNRN